MKAIILAAGKGTRLGGGDDPKPLTLLASGETILGRQIRLLTTFIPREDILIVVGYHKERIMHFLPGIRYVDNPDYAQENTSKSLLRALNSVNEDVLWLNGDVVFHVDVLSAALNYARTAMVVNEGSVGAEEVKYRSDASGRILEVSKMVAQPLGEAVGINYWSANDLPLLKRKLGNCGSQDYFEKGIEYCIKEDLEVHGITVPRESCTEIDFIEDLERANELIKNWSP
jgi:choline kinase